MDRLESLLPLLLLLIYFLAQLRKRSAKRQAAAVETPVAETQAAEIQAAETPDVQQPKRLTPFQEIIRQIQEAAEQAQAEQQAPTPATANTVAETPEVVLPPQPSALSLERSDFHEQGGFEHDEHGFGQANPFSEENFENQPASPPPPAHAPGHLDYDPHESLWGISAPSITGRKPNPVIKRLQSTSGLKEALILKEILDPPVSRRHAPGRRRLART
ncbi:MAG: hypothetical protein IIB09_02375 [Bacteroidetes bacterium]|nr:hypothetical protein [Bacteroidota bacterium]